MEPLVYPEEEEFDDPTECPHCQSTNLYFSVADGWTCLDCGWTDRDE